ncbi:MAG: hypothetical protein MJK14_13440 [Rivularia sp. ALOHA_DT_140]|nr:hypothetical protein [Rivularia sp. ALOHA_DT_140]
MKLHNIGLLTSAIVVCGMSSIAYAQDKLNDVGIVFRDGISLNQKIADIVKYVGSCPGYYEESVAGWFRDKEVEAVKGRRVRITNEKFADISNKIPYTDRKYEKNGKSQKIGFDFGSKHRGSKFVVKPGDNQFSYMIYDGKYDKPGMKVIKKGTFSVDVKTDYTERQRNISWNNAPRFVCLNLNGQVIQNMTKEDFEKCKFRGSQRVGSCAGRTVYGEVKPLRKVKDDE